jgi:hypothetical protein
MPSNQPLAAGSFKVLTVVLTHMAGVLDLVYVILVLAVAIGGVFGIVWVGRDVGDGDPTSDTLRAIAATAFVVLMAWPLVT